MHKRQLSDKIHFLKSNQKNNAWNTNFSYKYFCAIGLPKYACRIYSTGAINLYDSQCIRKFVFLIHTVMNKGIICNNDDANDCICKLAILMYSFYKQTRCIILWLAYFLVEHYFILKCNLIYDIMKTKFTLTFPHLC